MLHAHLDELLADYLTHNRNKLPSNTTLMELIQWSYLQAQEPAPNDPRALLPPAVQRHAEDAPLPQSIARHLDKL